jgi:hypothetical protein
MGGGARRHRRAPAGHSRPRRPAGAWLVLRQPVGVLVLPSAVGQGIHGRGRVPEPLQRRIAGRRQPVRGERNALRLAAARPHPRPRAHRLPARRRRQSARLAGSVLSSPRIRDRLHEIVARGGRVVVVDPRHSETARAFEHVAIRPDGDAWLLLALLQVIFADGLETRRAIAEQADGINALRALVSPHTPEAAEAHTGIPAAAVRAIARDLAAAPPRPPSTAAPAPALVATARSSASSSARSTSSPATSTATAARSLAPGRSRSRISSTGSGPTATARPPRGSVASPTSSAPSRSRSWPRR